MVLERIRKVVDSGESIVILYRAFRLQEDARCEPLTIAVQPTAVDFVTRMGDYSDVTVVDADGRNIPWPEVSHLGNNTMQDLMK